MASLLNPSAPLFDPFKHFVYHQFTCFLFLIFQYWFQNRRAKSRKLQKEMMPVYQTSPSNQFEPIPESRTTIPRRLHFAPAQPDSDRWKHAPYVSYRYSPMTENRLITSASNHPSIQLNQFRREMPVPFPTPNSNQCTIRRVEPARVARRSSRTQRSFHPYWMPYWTENPPHRNFRGVKH